MVLDVLLLYWFVCLFVCFVIACHCKITAYVGDSKLILILSYLILLLPLSVCELKMLKLCEQKLAYLNVVLKKSWCLRVG